MNKIFFVLCYALFTISQGLDFVPRPSEERSTLIWYISGNPKNTQYWINELDQFLKPYYTPPKISGLYVNCNPGGPPAPGSQRVCVVNMQRFGPCTSSYQYNFNSHTGGPCVFLKFDNNEIRGWEPGYYNASTYPEQMPQHLKQSIRNLESAGRSTKDVWVSCEGENPADIENIGPINYYPKMGFDGQYFPVSDVEGYLSPIVAVHFEKPERGIIIMIKCTAWAKELNGGALLDDQGSVHFELMVD